MVILQDMSLLYKCWSIQIFTRIVGIIIYQWRGFTLHWQEQKLGGCWELILFEFLFCVAHENDLNRKKTFDTPLRIVTVENAFIIGFNLMIVLIIGPMWNSWIQCIGKDIVPSAIRSTLDSPKIYLPFPHFRLIANVWRSFVVLLV